jgi:hypothetical protein
MEPARNRDQNFHSLVSASITLDELRFLQGLLENLSNRRGDLGHGDQVVPGDLESIETSSVEAYISGDVKLSGEEGRIKMPYITGFIFTCIKPRGGSYKLTWGSSLS